MTTNLSNLSVAQLKRAVSIREQIDSLSEELREILGGGANGVPSPLVYKKRKGMSAAGRARVAAAQRARWAKRNGKSRRKMSAAAKAKIAAAARARWAKAKAAGKNRL